MNLNQNKLSKYEWDCLEIPCSPEEKLIFNMIIDGFDNVNLIYNNSNTIQNFLKLNNKNLDEHIFSLIIESKLNELYKNYKPCESDKPMILFNIYVREKSRTLTKKLNYKNFNFEYN